MATDIMEFMPQIAPAVITCPTATIRDQIIESVRRFCWRTGLWKERLQRQDVVADQAEYDLTDPAILLFDGVTLLSDTGQITMLEHIEILQSPGSGPVNPVYIDLETTSERYLDENERGWRAYKEPKPRRFFVTPKRQLRLVYIPSVDITDGLDLFPSLMPLRTATTIEDFIWDDYRQLIEWGTLALLLEMPGVVWNDPDGAAYYWAKWDREMDEAYDRKETDYGDHQSFYRLKPDYRYF